MPYRGVNWQVQFFGRKWDFMDLFLLTLATSSHCLCLLAPFHFTWGALWVAIALYFVSGIGVTISYHRNLAHRSFKVPKWLEYSLAYCTVLSLQYDGQLKNVRDLECQLYYRFLHYTYFYHSVLVGVALYVVGGLPFLVWGMIVRLFGLLALGEGWHNNHHAFGYSARQGLERWQIDTTWYVIKFLQILGLATEVKLPTEIQKKRKALAKEDN